MEELKCKCGATITQADHDTQNGLCFDCWEDFSDIPDFQDFIGAMVKRYNEHRPEKGDSWVRSDLGWLYGKLKEEYTEIKELASIGGSMGIKREITERDLRQGELIDLGLMCFMVWAKEKLERERE